jgi:hypothetical protein
MPRSHSRNQSTRNTNIASLLTFISGEIWVDFQRIRPVGIVLLEITEGRGTVNPPPGTPFHADFNELLFVSIALNLMEVSVDCDRS